MHQTIVEEQSKITLPAEIVAKLNLIAGDVLNIELIMVKSFYFQIMMKTTLIRQTYNNPLVEVLEI